jgi:hypothetical protein
MHPWGEGQGLFWLCGVSANTETGRFCAWRQNRSEMAVPLSSHQNGGPVPVRLGTLAQWLR